jgi:hypothetical protein
MTGSIAGIPVTGGHTFREINPQFWGLNTRLTTLLFKKIIVVKSKEVKTGWSNSYMGYASLS